MPPVAVSCHQWQPASYATQGIGTCAPSARRPSCYPWRLSYHTRQQCPPSYAQLCRPWRQHLPATAQTLSLFVAQARCPWQQSRPAVATGLCHPGQYSMPPGATVGLAICVASCRPRQFSTIGGGRLSMPSVAKGTPSHSCCSHPCHPPHIPFHAEQHSMPSCRCIGHPW